MPPTEQTPPAATTDAPPGTPPGEAKAIARSVLRQWGGETAAGLVDHLAAHVYSDDAGDFDAGRLASWVARHGLEPPPPPADLKQGALPAPAPAVDHNAAFRAAVERQRGR
jgi:hypothetical protein